MGECLDRAKELRAIADPHHNCAQCVLIPFAEKAGMSAEQAYDVAQAFGGGMQTGSVCGAYTGALMALGLTGHADRNTVVALGHAMKQNHGGTLMCKELLAKNAEAGGSKKAHCDAMVYEAVALVEERLAAAGEGGE